MSEEHQRKVFLLKPEYPSYGICGSRGSGKSVLLEFVLSWYRKHGYLTLDWFGSLDHENAYWCIPDIVPIFDWARIPGEDEGKLVRYLMQCFDHGQKFEDYTVTREDDRSIAVDSKVMLFRIKLNKSMTKGKIVVDPDSIFPRSRWLITRRDGEGRLIIYGRDPKRKEKNIRVVGYPVLIILSKTTMIKQNDPLCVCGIQMKEHGEGYDCGRKDLLIKTIDDHTPLKEIIELTARENRVCIFNRGFYQDQRDAYRTLARFLKELPFLILRGSLPEKSIVLGMREAGQIAPSGLKGMKGDYETEVKRQLQTYIREARHLRTVLVLDFQRASDIAKSISSQRDFLFIKRSTRDLIPDDYQWLFENIEGRRWRAGYEFNFEIDEDLPSITRLKHWESYVLFPDRHYEKRTHIMADFHHKIPSDSWPRDANCQIFYLDKKEVEKVPAEKKIKELREKQAKRAQLEETLKEADRLHEDGVSWQELAKKYGWLDKKGCIKINDILRVQGFVRLLNGKDSCWIRMQS